MWPKKEKKSWKTKFFGCLFWVGFWLVCVHILTWLLIYLPLFRIYLSLCGLLKLAFKWDLFSILSLSLARSFYVNSLLYFHFDMAIPCLFRFSHQNFVFTQHRRHRYRCQHLTRFSQHANSLEKKYYNTSKINNNIHVNNTENIKKPTAKFVHVCICTKFRQTFNAYAWCIRSLYFARARMWIYEHGLFLNHSIQHFLWTLSESKEFSLKPLPSKHREKFKRKLDRFFFFFFFVYVC